MRPALSDGRFIGRGPLLRGAMVDLGPTACKDVAGLKFVVTTTRRAANERGYFRTVGIDPESEPVLVIKSRGHFRADFEAIARSIIEVDAPGPANPNLARYSFHAVRRPIWLLDLDVVWDGASS